MSSLHVWQSRRWLPERAPRRERRCTTGQRSPPSRIMERVRKCSAWSSTCQRSHDGSIPDADTIDRPAGPPARREVAELGCARSPAQLSLAADLVDPLANLSAR